MAPARVAIAMLLCEPRLLWEAFELNSVALQVLASSLRQRPARRGSPWVGIGNPLEMDLVSNDAGVGAPCRKGSLIPLANSRRQNVNLGWFKPCELLSSTFLAREARDERDVGRALRAAKQLYKSLESRGSDGTCGGAERIVRSCHTRLPRSSFQCSPG